MDPHPQESDVLTICKSHPKLASGLLNGRCEWARRFDMTEPVAAYGRIGPPEEAAPLAHALPL